LNPIGDIFLKSKGLEKNKIIFGESKEAEALFYQTLNETEGNIIYICYNHPVKISKEKLEGRTSLSSENVEYIDMLSYEGDEPAIFLGRPTEYNSLLEVLDEKMDTNKEYTVVLDNIDSIFIYDDSRRVMLFLKNLFNTVSAKDARLITYLVEGALESRIEKSVLSYADVVSRVRDSKGENKSDIDERWHEWKKMSFKDLFSFRSPLLFLVYVNQIVVILFLAFILLYILTS